ncbi:hypothetical protein AALC17_14500 [Oscillospiraceae bacterium 38-13]
MFHDKLAAAGMTQSMSRVGECINNGPMEGFWNILKREQTFFFCSAYRCNSDVCSILSIRKKIIEKLMLELFGLQEKNSLENMSNIPLAEERFIIIRYL